MAVARWVTGDTADNLVFMDMVYDVNSTRCVWSSDGDSQYWAGAGAGGETGVTQGQITWVREQAGHILAFRSGHVIKSQHVAVESLAWR